MTPTTTRFAPSPTGYLHIGSVRTALYAWLFARKHDGKFILRIEDTDQERSTKEAVDVILAGMDWLGLSYSGPYFQTQNLGRYKELVEKLLAEGKAYKCYCSKDRLEQLREQQILRKHKPKYDGHCRDLEPSDSDAPYVIRFKNPKEGVVQFTDLVRGSITVANDELDDVVLVRSDGMPTYNFSVVVDDADMQMTQVIRGDDHINNTPRQINIYKALGFPVPEFAHIPMILGDDGKRLSKRHGAVSVLAYKEQGVLPHALLNYLLRLGWSHGDQEIFSLAEMIELFNLDGVNKAPASFSTEKLLWLNQHYIKHLPALEILPALKQQFAVLAIDTANGPDLTAVLDLFRDRAETLQVLAAKARFMYQAPREYSADALSKHTDERTAKLLAYILEQLAVVIDWHGAEINAVLKKVAKDAEIKFPQVAQPLRIALTGDTQSPAIANTLEVLGKDAVTKRIEKFINYLLTA